MHHRSEGSAGLAGHCGGRRCQASAGVPAAPGPLTQQGAVAQGRPVCPQGYKAAPEGRAGRASLPKTSANRLCWPPPLPPLPQGCGSPGTAQGCEWLSSASPHRHVAAGPCDTPTALAPQPGPPQPWCNRQPAPAHGQTRLCRQQPRHDLVCRGQGGSSPRRGSATYRLGLSHPFLLPAGQWNTHTPGPSQGPTWGPSRAAGAAPRGRRQPRRGGRTAGDTQEPAAPV